MPRPTRELNRSSATAAKERVRLVPGGQLGLSGRSRRRVDVRRSPIRTPASPARSSMAIMTMGKIDNRRDRGGAAVVTLFFGSVGIIIVWPIMRPMKEVHMPAPAIPPRPRWPASGCIARSLAPTPRVPSGCRSGFVGKVHSSDAASAARTAWSFTPFGSGNSTSFGGTYTELVPVERIKYHRHYSKTPPPRRDSTSRFTLRRSPSAD